MGLCIGWLTKASSMTHYAVVQRVNGVSMKVTDHPQNYKHQT